MDETMLILHPTEDRLVVRAEPLESTRASGIVIPSTAQDKPQRGEVLAVGEEAEHLFKPGDKVLYSKYGGVEVQINNEDLLILRKSDVLALTEERDA